MFQKCKDCSVSYEITEGEKEFFESKGFPLPKRCKECREKKKIQNNSPFRKIR